ncbi:hypothetical protein PHYSODRAFT_246064 [Phytophthora sojae]|uniref:Uncharacterized protein n=1 Tax=Phytophthora sojae (strain P6497) TaxID=1094619 RepID=G4Z5Z4_PHYSP|nr:hypothetical protein PHYSODRAFT_246064 [Phytophthora sojae]EGZ20273.1 hypothetical protein PHYSODRAFT_246064 [Phytophthora sojae]|eukprot:XP_009522990.1 hypothetical protein PHYSODRAFT_246064 [Phytophthora sojae]
MSGPGRSPSRASSARSDRHTDRSSPDPPGRDPRDPRGEELRALIASRDAAVRNQEEVAALLLYQTGELDAAQAYIQQQNAELSSLRSEVAVRRSRETTSAAGVARALQLQGQVDQQVNKIRDLQRRIEQIERERDRLQENNDHLASEVSLATAEIQQLQDRNIDLDRDLEDANYERDIAEQNMDRAQEELLRVEAELQTGDQITSADLQQIATLTQERDRAHTSLAEVTRNLMKAREDLLAHQRMHTEARDKLNRLRATHRATMANLDQAVRERDNPELTRLRNLQETTVAGLAQVCRERDALQGEVDQVRSEFNDLQSNFDASEQTETAMGRRIQAIESESRLLTQDLIRMSHERDVLQQDISVARWQLTSITTLARARPGAIEEVLDPAYILSLIRIAPPPGSAEQQPAGETSDPAQRDPDPEADPELSPQVDSGTSKRDRDPETPDPEPTPAVKRRIFSPPSEHDEAMNQEGNRAASGSATEREIDDDGRGNPEEEADRHDPEGKRHEDLEEKGDDNPEEKDDGDQEEGDGDQGDGNDHEEGENDEDHEASEETNDDDAETEVMANELFEAQTREALSRSRSDERRRQHASPRRQLLSSAGGAPGDDDGSNPHEDPDPTPPQDPDPRSLRPDRARRPPVQDPLAPVVPFAADSDCIPGREHAHMPVSADCHPWLVDRLNDVAMVSMLIDVLFPILPTAPGWLFPYFGPAQGRRPKIQLSDYCWELLTEENVRALLDTHLWEILENPGDAISFEVNVGGRLGILIQEYGIFEDTNLMSYWESTHHFPIPDAMAKKYPWLIVFQKERSNRRSHAGRAWKQFLELLITVMWYWKVAVSNAVDPPARQSISIKGQSRRGQARDGDGYF